MRILKMLTVVHELVHTGRSAPQRDIFYQLKAAPLFTAPRQVADALEVSFASKEVWKRSSPRLDGQVEWLHHTCLHNCDCHDMPLVGRMCQGCCVCRGHA